MTYVVDENESVNTWIVLMFGCRLFYEGENMLVIHPDECIDCGV